MAVEHLGLIADTLMQHGRAGNTPVSVIVDGTLPTQHIITTALNTVARDASAAGIRPPAVVVVGEVVKVAAQIAGLSRGSGDVVPGGTFVPAPAQSRSLPAAAATSRDEGQSGLIDPPG
jgi:hypothetical protein